MSDQPLICPDCKNTSPPQPLAGKDGVTITCQLTHRHKSKRPVEMEESE